MRFARLALLPLLAAACTRTVATAPSPARTTPPSPPRLALVDALLPAPPLTVGLDPELPARLDSIVRIGLEQGAAPGAALAVARYGRLVHLKGYGATDYAPGAPAVDATTIYDLA